ncbi:hypothetical protein F9C07_11404 [Aspergillus flavus]|uniref:Uncharacterized protein n=3 Tax=Aspergillus subgen. Circumdati TaxID=2720871 RepID=B8NS92_ASPFN|nr:uncharacterized protein G4B84_000039 [Aspergillus flavus NRRL3357]KAB8250640.1 hypothetical protein BDV35DRAFT_389059 [Aspergillus flavus]OOO04465.1 hypothetical protein OAory_01053120 [Aspergillus oryzae]KAF7630700.1 hypothetical protein AFLA_011321 [Aspergillus flavus NRRL3357]QMW24794.1 hypothetical protein G4B84_000039 [Aspergillus flavus NRRL3357]QRD89315.1 hypothetical protein F9C07_11404 [Aspergillus flavus]
MSTLMQASRPLARARSKSNTMRPFSIAIPARLANEWMHMPKPRGFLAEKDTTPRQESPYGKKMEFNSLRSVQQTMSEHGHRLDQLEKSMQQLTRMQGVY